MRRFRQGYVGVLAGVAAAFAVFAAGPGAETAHARDKACGKITIHYSYGDYRFRVVVTNGPLRCERARKVMRRGIPVTRPDPPGWYCREARGRRFSDVCIKRRGGKKVVKARYLGPV